MVLKIASFTAQGEKTENLIKKKLPGDIWISRQNGEDLKSWAGDGFSKRLPLIFVGAAGIAVRASAPFVRDKLCDSPVIVVDERGKFVIPLLSGHFGGANEIASMIAKKTGAVPVITTATDVEKKFAADVFARKNQLKILNRSAIKKVSEKILDGKNLKIWVNPKIKISGNLIENHPENIELTSQKKDADIVVEKDFRLPLLEDAVDMEGRRQSGESPVQGRLFLSPKTLCVGVGCKKGKSFEELKNFLLETFDENSLKMEEIASFSSLDIKKDELGLLTLAQFFNVPFFTFSAEELLQAQGSFSESEFVKKITGVPNVCERAAVLAAGKNSRLLLKKTCADGMTLAAAERIPEIKSW